MIHNHSQNTMFVIFVMFNIIFKLSKGWGVYPLKKWGGYNPQEIRGYVDGWMDGMVWYVNNVKMLNRKIPSHFLIEIIFQLYLRKFE